MTMHFKLLGIVAILSMVSQVDAAGTNGILLSTDYLNATMNNVSYTALNSTTTFTVPDGILIGGSISTSASPGVINNVLVSNVNTKTALGSSATTTIDISNIFPSTPLLAPTLPAATTGASSSAGAGTKAGTGAGSGTSSSAVSSATTGSTTHTPASGTTSGAGAGSGSSPAKSSGISAAGTIPGSGSSAASAKPSAGTGTASGNSASAGATSSNISDSGSSSGGASPSKSSGAASAPKTTTIPTDPSGSADGGSKPGDLAANHCLNSPTKLVRRPSTQGSPASHTHHKLKTSKARASQRQSFNSPVGTTHTRKTIILIEHLDPHLDPSSYVTNPLNDVLDYTMYSPEGVDPTTKNILDGAKPVSPTRRRGSLTLDKK